MLSKRENHDRVRSCIGVTSRKGLVMSELEDALWQQLAADQELVSDILHTEYWYDPEEADAALTAYNNTLALVECRG